MVFGIFMRYCFLSLKGLIMASAIGLSCATPILIHDAEVISSSSPQSNSNPLERKRPEEQAESSKISQAPKTDATVLPSTGKALKEKPALPFLQRVYLNGALQLMEKGAA